jgi:tetratricopeptide (TPR) repeat protein
VAQADSLDLIQQAVAALQRRAWEEAARLAATALERSGPEPNALMVLGGVRAQAGDLQGAIALYERARVLMPTHIHVLVNLATAYRADGRLPEARRALEAALQVDPGFAIAHNNLGNVLSDLGERQEALRSYERAAALDPHYADPLAGSACIAEEEHRLEDAGRLAGRALQLAPQSVSAALTLARVNLRRDQAAEAIRILEALLRGGSLSPTNRVVAHGYLGEAYDKLARYQDAFAAFTAANALQQEQYAATLGGDPGPLSPASIVRLTAFLEQSDPARWSPAPPAVASPVFLVGFPRSGTTLLDQILASHPQITTLEERDILLDAVSGLLREEALGHWADLSPAQIGHWRERYWQRVASSRAGAQLAPLFIDKQPLNAVLLPLIHRLFPAARILLVLRDPRDVVLSCYQQRFGMNTAMYQLLRLDTATAYYAAVMRLVEASRRRLALRLHVVRYEDLVGSFEATARSLLGFLGLEWDERVRQHTATARRRTIGTPSAAQVVLPIYASARGKWRNYREFLEPHLPALEPWVRAYGYDAP